MTRIFWRWAGRLLLCFVLAIIGVYLVGRARLVDGGVLAYIADCDGESDVFLMDVSHKMALRLTSNDDARHHMPQWTDDELRFVEGSTYPLIFYGAREDVIPADTPGFFLPYSPNEVSNIWGQAPDGRWALVMFRDNNYELYITDIGNQQARRFTYNRCDEHYPRWQP